MKQKKLFTYLRIAAGICAAWGWWGVLYPELTLTPSTYRIVCEDTAVQEQEEVVEWDFDDGIYWKLLDTDSSRIRFRSRLLQELKALQKIRE